LEQRGEITHFWENWGKWTLAKVLDRVKKALTRYVHNSNTIQGVRPELEETCIRERRPEKIYSEKRQLREWRLGRRERINGEEKKLEKSGEGNKA